MSNQKIEIRKFGQYNVDKLLYELDRDGEAYTVDSEYNGTGYAYKNGTLIICGGKNGALSVALSEARRFLEEVMGVVELMEYRKQEGVKGA